jgi:hypothetical protein
MFLFLDFAVGKSHGEFYCTEIFDLRQSAIRKCMRASHNEVGEIFTELILINQQKTQLIVKS